MTSAMKRPIASGLLGALLVACSAGSNTPQNETTNAFALPTPPTESEYYCSTTDVLGRTVLVVNASKVVREDTPFVSRPGSKYLVLRVDNAATLSSRTPRQGIPTGDDVDVSLTSVLVGPIFRPGSEAATVDELLVDTNPVLILNVGEVGTKQVRPILVAAGHLEADGRIELLGRCGVAMQPSLDESAAQFGTNASAEWLTRVADPESDEAVAALSIFAGLVVEDSTPRQPFST